MMAGPKYGYFMLWSPAPQPLLPLSPLSRAFAPRTGTLARAADRNFDCL